MIRKATHTETDMSAMDPTPQEILERTKEIRSKWTPRERARRLGIKRAAWMPPMVSEYDFPSGPGEYDAA